MHSQSVDNSFQINRRARSLGFAPVLYLALAFLFTSCNRDPEYARRRDLANGDRYAAIGKLREADIMYRSALRRDPRFGEAHYRRAMIQEKQGQLGAAVGSLRRAVELLPEEKERTDARIRLGRCLVFYLDQAQLELPLVEELDQLATDLIKKKLDPFFGHFFKAEAALFQARRLENLNLTYDAKEALRRAEPEFQAANTLKPRDPAVVLALARTQWALNEFDSAESLLRSMLQKHPESVGGWRELYRLLTTQKHRGGDAEAVLKAAVAANSKDYSLLVTLAEFYQLAGRRAEADGALALLKTHAAEYPEAYQKAAELYLLLGERENAVRQYEEAIQSLPRHKLQYQKLLAAAYVGFDRKEKASAIVDQILKEHPKDMDAQVARAELRLNSGDASGALLELQRLVNEAPAHVTAQHNLGRAYLAAGRREDARIHFTEALRVAPRFVPARLQLAEIEFDTGEYLKVTLTAEEALKLDPGNVRAKLLRAAGLRKLKRFAESRTQIEEVLAAAPRHAFALYQLAELEFDQGKLEAAEALFRKSYEANPSSATGLLAVVDLQLAMGKGAKGLEILQAEVRRFPARKDLRLNLGDLALRLNRCEIALPVYDGLIPELTADKPALAQVENRLGSCYRLNGRFAEALSHFQKAREIAPQDFSIHHNLGIVYDQLGRKAEARASYEASIKLQGSNPVALNNLAFHIAEDGGDLDQALTYAQRARTLSPLQLEFADTVGWIYFKKDLPKVAAEIFAELVGKQPDNPTFRYHYGAALLKQGERDRARKELKAALAAGVPVDEKSRILRLIYEHSL